MEHLVWILGGTAILFSWVMSVFTEPEWWGEDDYWRRQLEDRNR